MGNCTGKPRVKESDMAPAPPKEETLPVSSEVKPEGETKDIVTEEGGEANKVEDQDKKEENGNSSRSLGVLISEAKDDAEAEIAPAAKSSTVIADEDASKAVVPTEPTKTESLVEVAPAPQPALAPEPALAPTPAPEQLKEEPTELAAPVVEAVKVDTKPEDVSEPATKVVEKENVDERQEKHVQVEKPVEALSVSSTEKVDVEEPKKEN